jgi:hypothetical protein
MHKHFEMLSEPCAMAMDALKKVGLAKKNVQSDISVLYVGLCM